MRYNPIKLSSATKSLGFTLIEIIIGIVALSISLSLVVQLIVPTEEHSADQIHQIKAAELGQSLIDEILAKAFDENSDMAGGRLRCDEDQDDSGTVEADEKCSDTLGYEVDEVDSNNIGDRNKFDDVDDYHNYSNKNNATNTAIHSGYDSFSVDVKVTYDTADTLNLGLVAGQARLAKRITVTVTTPLGTAMEFAAYRTNF